MDNTLKAECLIQAFKEAATAQQEVSDARASYDGYSFDYYYRGSIEEAEQKAKQAVDLLIEFIDARVAEKLKDFKL